STHFVARTASLVGISGCRRWPRSEARALAAANASVYTPKNARIVLGGYVMFHDRGSMKRANRTFLLLAALMVFRCGGRRSRNPRVVKDGTDAPGPAKVNPRTGELATSKTNTKPEAFTRANFLRLDQGISEAELGQIFGPPQESYPESKDTRRYTWKNGKDKLQVDVRGGKVVSSLYPGEFEERQNRTAAIVAARSLMDDVRRHVLKNKNRFPERLDDLDPDTLARHSPETKAIFKRGDAVFSWGKSANRLVWAWWKDTPEHG